jgi:hypothetical protein
MTPSRRIIYRTATAAALLAMLAGCASVPPPTAEVSAADAAITLAATPDDQHYAAEELAKARDELASAQSAMVKQVYDMARQFAAEAQADADLAHAKGRALGAQAAVAAKVDENATLRRRLLDQETLK